MSILEKLDRIKYGAIKAMLTHMIAHLYMSKDAAYRTRKYEMWTS